MLRCRACSVTTFQHRSTACTMNSGFHFSPAPPLSDARIPLTYSHPPNNSILQLIPGCELPPTGVTPTQQLLFCHSYVFLNSQYYHHSPHLDTDGSMQARGIKRQPDLPLHYSPNQKRPRPHDHLHDDSTSMNMLSMTKKEREIIGRVCLLGTLDFSLPQCSPGCR